VRPNSSQQNIKYVQHGRSAVCIHYCVSRACCWLTLNKDKLLASYDMYAKQAVCEMTARWPISHAHTCPNSSLRRLNTKLAGTNTATHKTDQAMRMQCAPIVPNKILVMCSRYAAGIHYCMSRGACIFNNKPLASSDI
jgi:hypothetical protein